MPCFDSYITIDSSTPSRSGLYASDLPGIDNYMLDGIAKNTAITPDDDHDDIYATIYKRATRNLVSDVSKNVQDKFFLNLKLITRETSSYLTINNSGSSQAGVKLSFVLPKYAKVHIISIGVYSAGQYNTGNIFTVRDTDSSGELLKTVNTSLVAGRNTVNVDSDFEVDNVFIGYSPATYSFRKTENKYFNNTQYNSFDPVICDQCFYGDPDFKGSVEQINGGGLDVKYMVYCSLEKYVCENIKLFEDALLYKIGYEITVERRLGERLTKYTVMSQERWDELSNFYKAQYEENLMNAVGGMNITEDNLCFACKNTVRVETLLP